jgi:hypothetical protein
MRGGMAHFAQRLGFDLADALAGDVELAAHFLQRARVAVAQAEAQFQDLALALVRLERTSPNLSFNRLKLVMSDGLSVALSSMKSPKLASSPRPRGIAGRWAAGPS